MANMKKIYNISLHADPLYEVTLFIGNMINDGIDLSKYSIFLPNRRTSNILKKNLYKYFTNEINRIKKPLDDSSSISTTNSSFVFPQLKVISDEFAFNKLKITMLITNLLRKNIINIPINIIYELADSLSELLINLTIQEIEPSEFHNLVPEKLIEYWSHTITILEECFYNKEISKEIYIIKNKFNVFINSISENNEKVISIGIGGINNYTKKFLKSVLSSDNGIIFMIGNEIKKSKNYYCNKKLIEELQIDESKITENIITAKKNQKNFLEISEFCYTNEEALAIAAATRKAISEKKRVLIVTADKKLGQKIKNELLYWNIFIDDSSGIPFFKTKVGILISNIIDVIGSNYKTIETLNILKTNKDLIMQIHELELFLKKQQIIPPFFFDAISVYFSKNIKSTNFNNKLSTELYELIKKLEEISKINIQNAHSFSVWVDITKQIASIIDVADSAYFENIISNFKKYSDLLCQLTFDEYKLLLKNQILNISVRPSTGYTDNVIMLGMLEAQLLDADLIIIAGANESNMSPTDKDDFWFSKSMLNLLNINYLEVKNEFTQCIFERLVYKSHTLITRSQIDKGIQQQQYSYIDKLATHVRINKSNIWNNFLELINKEYKEVRFQFIPPLPQLKYRPNNFSVTDLDLLKNNPYAFYAKKILKLKELRDEPEQKNIRGNYIHKILEYFFKENKNERTFEKLNAIAKKILQEMYLSPDEFGIWFFRLNNIFSFVLNNMDDIAISIPEIKGEYNINLINDYNFSISCIADRIDILNDGSIRIIDYKTGLLPTLKQVEYGFKPQLSIEALIAEKGNFYIGQKKVSSLCFWKLNGSKNGGEIYDLTNNKEKTSELIEKTLDGLMHLIYKYNVECIPYDVNPNYQYNEKYNHLARVKEWFDA